MEREAHNDQLCWTAMNPSYQGEGLIDITYYDYLVNDVMTSEYQYKKIFTVANSIKNPSYRIFKLAVSFADS